jgi:hypothetical protein
MLQKDVHSMKNECVDALPFSYVESATESSEATTRNPKKTWDGGGEKL